MSKEKKIQMSADDIIDKYFLKNVRIGIKQAKEHMINGT